MATVALMGVEEYRRADHGPYIAAVVRSIEGSGIRVANVAAAISGDGRREAVLRLWPDESAFAWRVAGEVRASWDEDDGWSLLVQEESVVSLVYKGMGVLPDPEDVAAWVVVALARPELTPSYEDGPSRSHSVSDPEFEARLARCAATP